MDKSEKTCPVIVRDRFVRTLRVAEAGSTRRWSLRCCCRSSDRRFCFHGRAGDIGSAPNCTNAVDGLQVGAISRDENAHGNKNGALERPPKLSLQQRPPVAVSRDGSYTGSQADAHWGTVQVLAVVSNGQLSDVQFTEYPNHRNRSQEINSQAMPILTQEAVQSQQAQVDVVSGATDTSEAFIQSLSSALSQAS